MAKAVYRHRKAVDARVERNVLNLSKKHGDKSWAVLEEIDGAPLEIHFNVETNKVKFHNGKRFLQRFEPYAGLDLIKDGLERAMRGIGKMFYFYKDSDIRVKSFVMYGVMFGGSLDGKTDEGSVVIEGFTQYSSSNNFALYGITMDGAELPGIGVGTAASVAQLFYPIITVMTTLISAIDVPTNTDSRVSVLFNHTEEPIEDNAIFGTLVIPWDAPLQRGRWKTNLFFENINPHSQFRRL